VAECERILIAERMRRGRLSKYHAGVLLPWKIPTLCYQVNPDRPRDPTGVQINEVQAVAIREIFAFYLQEDINLFRLVKHLHDLGIPSPIDDGYWSVATVRGMLKNPAYSGQVYTGRTHPAKAQGRRSAVRPAGKLGQSNLPAPTSDWILVAQIPAIITQEVFEQVKTKLAHNQSFALRNNAAQYYVCQGKNSRIYCHLEQRCPAHFFPAN